jgi:membrane protease YdiL (CAAX protease family)
VYALLRVWLASWPFLWLRRVERRRVRWSPVAPGRRREAAIASSVLALLFVAAILVVYALVGREWLDPQQLREVAQRTGFATPARYLAFGAFLCLANSLIEEYVWRWFVYRRCEELVRPAAAVPLSAALFTLHHVIAFSLQLGLRAGLLASLGVFAAGCIWSACYLRYRSIWPGWVSHVAADVVGLAIGWRILFG